jgi:hypothetical protein
MVSTIRWKVLGSGLSKRTQVSTFLFARIVVLIKWRTWAALDSGKVRFAMVHIYGEGLGVKGMAKKVVEGVDQHCCLRSVSAAACGMFATRKHQGAEYFRVGIARAKGGPMSGSGMVRAVAIAFCIFWAVSLALGWYPPSQG